MAVVIYSVNSPSEAIAEVSPQGAPFELELVFRAQYERVARIIARVVRDPARAEELAVEVFLKLWRNPNAQNQQVEPWLYRVALHQALDELRRQSRRSRYERIFHWVSPSLPPATPEQIHSVSEQQDAVRTVLNSIDSRQAQFLILRSEDFSYAEIASILSLNPASVGTLLNRAQQAFREEYIKRYGTK